MGALNAEGDISLDGWTKADTAAARGIECGGSYSNTSAASLLQIGTKNTV